MLEGMAMVQVDNNIPGGSRLPCLLSLPYQASPRKVKKQGKWEI